jgi:hypothetical protein
MDKTSFKAGLRLCSKEATLALAGHNVRERCDAQGEKKNRVPGTGTTRFSPRPIGIRRGIAGACGAPGGAYLDSAHRACLRID